jgi:hypothetical protein
MGSPSRRASVRHRILRRGLDQPTIRPGLQESLTIKNSSCFKMRAPEREGGMGSAREAGGPPLVALPLCAYVDGLVGDAWQIPKAADSNCARRPATV